MKLKVKFSDVKKVEKFRYVVIRDKMSFLASFHNKKKLKKFIPDRTLLKAGIYMLFLSDKNNGKVEKGA